MDATEFKDTVAKFGSKFAKFVSNQVEQAQTMDLRITRDDLKESLSRSKNLTRSDVPKEAYDAQGNGVKVPSDLKDDFNIMYKDARGQLIAANYLMSDFEDRSTPCPSPAEPILGLREFYPLLATVPLMALTGISSIFGILAMVAYAIFGKGERSFFGAIKFFIFGKSVWAGSIPAAIFFWLMFSAPGWMASAILPLWMYARARSWLADRNYKSESAERSMLLFGQTQHLTRTGYATQTYLEDQMHTADRQRQANQAVQDPMPLLDINATATGYFASHGSLNSPDEGKNMVFSGTDLGAAMLAVGTTGTGKTYTVLTPLMKEVARVNREATKPEHKYGLFLMDDKGDLPPRGMAIFDDFQLISPEDFLDRTTGKTIKAATFAPMQGLKAEQVAKLIGDIFATSGEIWDKAAQEKFLYTLIIMEACKKVGMKHIRMTASKKLADGTFEIAETGEIAHIKWNFETVFRLVLSDEQTKQILLNLGMMDKGRIAKGEPGFIQNDPLLPTAYRYFKENYYKLADTTRSSVNFNVSAWHTESVNRYMKPWWEAEEGVLIEDIFKGKAMGIYCPEFRYGITGKLVNTLVRARIYNFVKNRSSTWEEGGTRAMLMWDEFALGIGKGDMEANILPIQRSLGLTSVFATQTITEVRARMGREKADAMLDNLTKNVVCLATDAESYRFMEEKFGTFRGMLPSSRSKNREQPVTIDFFGTQRAKTLAGLEGIQIYDEERLQNKNLNVHQDNNHSNMYNNLHDSDIPYRYIDAATLSMEEMKVFDSNELSRILKFNFHAFMYINRGNGPRYDIVKLGPKN